MKLSNFLKPLKLTEVNKGLFNLSKSKSNLKDNATLELTMFVPHNSNDAIKDTLNKCADQLEDIVDTSVDRSIKFHSTNKSSHNYCLELDSFMPNNPEGYTGIFIASPFLSLDQIMSDLSNIKEWASRESFITNSNSHLAIRISLPKYTHSHVDFLKLAIVMLDNADDKGEKFKKDLKRTAKLSLDNIHGYINHDNHTVLSLFDNLMSKLQNISFEFIAKNLFNSNTHNIHFKSKHELFWIELRSPSDDWMHDEQDAVETPLYKLMISIRSAIDPSDYQSEYTSKLANILELPLHDSFLKLIIKSSKLDVSKKETLNAFRSFNNTPIKDFK